MIRIVRVMEYEYDTLEQANADMARWQVPQIGEKRFGTLGPLIRSTVTLPHSAFLPQEHAVELTRRLPDPNDLVGQEMTVTVPKDRDDEAPNTGWVSC